MLNECMNKEILQRSEFFDNKANKDNGEYWRNWSEATEKGRLHFLGHSGVVKMVLTGRGNTIFVKRTPKSTRERKDEDDLKHERNQWSRKV